ncbi:PEP-CTERM sorting domain-containing protein [Okeania sp. SIO3B5]|uniref:PEP-CTERM sorting domain-containing protein n=1 Tax=Okeania sp. SIO3B5 TaxID=2607811 RepID=UPI0025D2C942|nr:PEP-CTERM sorting domain-containing protein [Okeania sp. SIO3B5]
MKLFNTCSRYLGLTTSLFLGIATSQSAQAATLGFESIPNWYEGMPIHNQFLNDYGMTFSLIGGGFPVLAEVGGPKKTGFTTNNGTRKDRPISAANGNFFITDDDGGKERPKSLFIEYAQPVSIASGEILDIDQRNRNSRTEEWTVKAFDISNNLLDWEVFTSGPRYNNTGDGVATPWLFENLSADISSVLLEFTGTKNNNIGVGFDNFFAQVAQPVPPHPSPEPDPSPKPDPSPEPDPIPEPTPPGGGGQPEKVPEPSAMAMLGMTAIALLRYKRHS